MTGDDRDLCLDCTTSTHADLPALRLHLIEDVPGVLLRGALLGVALLGERLVLTVPDGWRS